MQFRPLFITIFCTLAVSPCFAKQPIQAILPISEMASSSQCYFIPPEGWEIADPKTFKPSVKISFLKRSSKGFCPSINLAVEETQVSLNDYLKAVRAIHEQDRNTHWRALGKVRTAAGLAQLTEIDSSTELGPIRILQLILIKEGQAYILTAAAHKEEFADYYKDFQSAFRSLTLTSDLLSNVPQLDRRETLKEKQDLLILAAENFLQESIGVNPLIDPAFQEKFWIPFQQSVLDNFEDMGPFWQVLLLKNTQEKLLSLEAYQARLHSLNSGDQALSPDCSVEPDAISSTTGQSEPSCQSSKDETVVELEGACLTSSAAESSASDSQNETAIAMPSAPSDSGDKDLSLECPIDETDSLASSEDAPNDLGSKTTVESPKDETALNVLEPETDGQNSTPIIQ
jgi:hypothetical protein